MIQRRKLPHIYVPGNFYFITYRLFNSLSKNLLEKIRARYVDLMPQLDEHKRREINKKYFLEVDKLLDSSKTDGINLTSSNLYEIIKESLFFWHEKKIELISYCVMSNHVHFVCFVNEEFEGDPVEIDDLMKSIKWYSSRECNKLLNKQGQFWEHESYDRLVRDRRELYNVIAYTLDNPIKAGLCENRHDWPCSYINDKYNEFI